jgi:hypothetical protein
MPTARGPLMLLALVVVLCACATPSPTATPPTASPVVGSPTAPVRTEDPVQSPSDGSHASPVPSASMAGILGVLPGTVNGATTTRITLSPSGRTTPKVFLKVLGRLGGTPPEMTLGLAFAPGGTAYAMRVVGVTGDQILRAFLEERTGLPPGASAPPELTVGGKQATRLGQLPGTFLYADADTFYYIETSNEAAAGEIIEQLP